MTPEEEDLVRAYRLVFNSPHGRVVLMDLMKFSKFRTDVKSDVDEGQRRVFLRILNFSQLTDEQLIRLYVGQQIQIGETE